MSKCGAMVFPHGIVVTAGVEDPGVPCDGELLLLSEPRVEEVGMFSVATYMIPFYKCSKCGRRVEA